MTLFRLVDPPTVEDAQTARAVVAAYRFPWEWTLARNVRETGQATLPIVWVDREGSDGWYDPTVNVVNLDPLATYRGGADRAGVVLAHELGHLIDDTVLTHATRREIHRLMHDGSSTPLDACPSGDLWRSSAPHTARPNEAFANLAPHIWCPDFAKPMDRYGPHLFHRKDDIEELVMADAVNKPPFDDIAGHTFEDDILWLARQGIAYGSRGKFRPNETVTRGQMAAFLRRALEKNR